MTLTYLFSLLALILILLSCSECQELVSPSGKDCNSKYSYSTGLFSSDCVSGVLYPDFYDLDFKCDCKCSLPWNYKFDHKCLVPRYHRITCGFGGPRWFINCWNPSSALYKRYQSLIRFSHKHLPINIKFNSTSYNISLSYTLTPGDFLLYSNTSIKYLNFNLHTFSDKLLHNV